MIGVTEVRLRDENLKQISQAWPKPLAGSIHRVIENQLKGDKGLSRSLFYYNGSLFMVTDFGYMFSIFCYVMLLIRIIPNPFQNRSRREKTRPRVRQCLEGVRSGKAQRYR